MTTFSLLLSNRNDWLLKILYGATSVAVNGVAGLKPISVEHKRLVNVDLSELIHGKSLILYTLVSVSITRSDYYLSNFINVQLIALQGTLTTVSKQASALGWFFKAPMTY